MVRVFRAETGEHHTAVVGFAVAVRIFEKYDLGAVGDIRAAVAGFDTRGNQQPAGEDRRFVGFAVAIAVFEHQHLVIGLLTGFDMGINLAAGHP